ncbi:hypothetical protein MMC30_000600 [Trapelia coarctata]|nr:hypothetical protein [Trapelia coarctata]
MKSTIIASAVLFMASSVLGAQQIVMRAPTHAMNEYRAVFNSAPVFADLTHISPYNLAGFDPHHLPLSMGGIRGASRIGVMMM